jgi:hypothetical protein
VRSFWLSSFLPKGNLLPPTVMVLDAPALAGLMTPV